MYYFFAFCTGVQFSFNSVCLLKFPRTNYTLFGILCKFQIKEYFVIGVLTSLVYDLTHLHLNDYKQKDCIPAPEIEISFLTSSSTSTRQKVITNGSVNSEQLLLYHTIYQMFFISLKINAKNKYADDSLYKFACPIKGIKKLKKDELEKFFYIVPTIDGLNSIEGESFNVYQSIPKRLHVRSADFILANPPTIDRASWVLDSKGNLMGLFNARARSTDEEEYFPCTCISLIKKTN